MLCIQQRFKSVCSCAQSDQSLSFPPEETLDTWLPIERLSKIDQTERCTIRAGVQQKEQVGICAHQRQIKVIKLFSCSTKLSTTFILLINVKMPTIVGILTFISMINTIA